MPDDQIQPEDPKQRRVQREPDEDRPRRRRSDDDDDDDDVRRRIRNEGDATGGLIPYKNPQALIGYYLGVFSLIPCVGLALAPVALILGILGLMYKKKHPTAGGTAHAVVAIVLGTLVLLGHLALILLGVGASILK